MRRRYRYVEHTADVEFVAYGRKPDELFKNAFLAMFDTAADIKLLSKQKSRTIRFSLKERSEEAEDLLWRALQDALSIASARGLFAYGVESLHLEETKKGLVLSATLLCKKETAELAKLDVKGVSKYDLVVSKKGGRLEASVVLDV